MLNRKEISKVSNTIIKTLKELDMDSKVQFTELALMEQNESTGSEILLDNHFPNRDKEVSNSYSDSDSENEDFLTSDCDWIFLCIRS